MSLFDDIVSLPGKLVSAAVELSSEAIAQTLTLPLHVVEAAKKSGCKTVAEVEAWAERMMEDE